MCIGCPKRFSDKLIDTDCSDWLQKKIWSFSEVNIENINV